MERRRLRNDFRKTRFSKLYYPFGVDKYYVLLHRDDDDDIAEGFGRLFAESAAEILNLSSSFGDDDDECYSYCKASIDRAFRKHALRAHPDKKTGR